MAKRRDESKNYFAGKNDRVDVRKENSDIVRNLPTRLLPVNEETEELLDGKVGFIEPVVAGNVPYFNDLTPPQLIDSGVSVDRLLGFTYWKGLWSEVEPYVPGDQVLSRGWLCIANVGNTGVQPAPVPVGPPEMTAENAIFNQTGNTSVIYSGHAYTFLEPGYLQEVWVYVPELTANTNYRVVMIDDTNPLAVITKIINNPVLQINSWSRVALGAALITTGSHIIIYLDSLNTGADTQVTGGWTYGGSDNNNAPATSAWNKTTQSTLLRIDKTDLGTVDRTAELLGVIIDSSILFVETASPDNFLEYRVTAAPVDQGTYIQYTVSQINSGGTIPVSQPTTMTATIPIADDTKYVEELNFWPTNSPSWVNIEGVLQYNGVDQPGHGDTVFGVDIEYQRLTKSEEWDLQQLSPELDTSLSAGPAATSNLESIKHHHLDLTPQVHNGVIWTEIYLDTTPYMFGDEYLMDFNIFASSDKTTKKFSLRVLVNGVIVATFIDENKDIGESLNYSRSSILVPVVGQVEVSVEAWTESVGTTLTATEFSYTLVPY